MRRVLARTVCLCAALNFTSSPARAATPAPTLRHVGWAIRPATTDGGRYVVWVRTSGALGVFDTRSHRVRSTGPLCGTTGPSHESSIISAGEGAAVFGCGELSDRSYFAVYVRLRDLKAYRLVLPPAARGTAYRVAVGRYWLAGDIIRDPAAPPLAPGDAGAGFLLNRTDGRLRLTRDGVLLDPDSRNGTRLRVAPSGVAVTLDSGYPYVSGGLLGNGVVIDDPFTKRPVTLLRSGCAGSCNDPFGSARRAVFTIGYQVRLIINRRERARWFVSPMPPPAGPSSDQDFISAALTPSVVAISQSTQLSRYNVLIARA